MLFGLGVYLSLTRGACWCFLSGPWLDGGDNDDEVDGDCDDDSAVDSDDNDENEDEVVTQLNDLSPLYWDQEYTPRRALPWPREK